MKIQAFELLNEKEKEEALWKRGTFIIHLSDGDSICDVYELFGFYVAFRYEMNKNERAKIYFATYPDELPHFTKLRELLKTPFRC